MRAVLVAPECLREVAQIELADDAHHHIATVLRMRAGDELLLLDGTGGSARAKITAIDRRVVTVLRGEVERTLGSSPCDLLIITPKKDALDLMLKSATELAVRRIYLFRGTYSQEKLPDAKRVDALLRSALEQSNARWLPEVRWLSKLEDLPVADYEHILLMEQGGECAATELTGAVLAAIGPEGGVSGPEREFLLGHAASRILSLPTPILRAPTALAAGVGWVIARRLRP